MKLQELIDRLKAEGDGCCCHDNHEAIPGDERWPEIPAVPPSERCCALRRRRTIEALEQAQRELNSAVSEHRKMVQKLEHRTLTLGAKERELAICQARLLKTTAQRTVGETQRSTV